MDRTMMNQVAWIGDGYIRGGIRGVALSFHGLNATQEKAYPNTVELEWTRAGWLVVYPYYGPWAWMNRETRAFIDELVKSIYAEYSLDEAIPLASTGDSMGGFSALLYARYAKKPVSACLALYPACDLKYHFSERPDVPRTILQSFRGYGNNIEDIFIEHSPLAQVSNMPDIPYLFIHGDKDLAVNKAAHSDKMVLAMRTQGLNVEYMEVPGMGHGTCIPLSVQIAMAGFLVNYR